MQYLSWFDSPIRLGKEARDVRAAWDGAVLHDTKGFSRKYVQVLRTRDAGMPRACADKDGITALYFERERGAMLPHRWKPRGAGRAACGPQTQDAKFPE